MIELIHKYPVLIKVLLAVVTVTFIATGGWLLGKEDVTSYAAKVGKRKITMQDYQDTLSRMEEFYRKAYKGGIPEELMKKLDLNKRAVDALIEKQIVLSEAERRGMTVTDQELTETIIENKSFQDEAGRFNKARYVETLRLNGLTPALYEKKLRDDLVADKFKKMVKDSVYVTEDEARSYYRKQMESQNKEFKEEEFQTQKQNLWKLLTMNLQEKTYASFMEGLRGSYKIEINPSVLVSSASS